MVFPGPRPEQFAFIASHDLQEAIATAGATVTHDRLPLVTGVPTELRQLFTNLVGNAVKFGGGEPVQVHVGAARDGPMWRFSVADNGIGLDPDQAERIFEVFKRLHQRGRYPGTGIGLAICKKVVEHHGGLTTEAAVEPVPVDRPLHGAGAGSEVKARQGKPSTRATFGGFYR